MKWKKQLQATNLAEENLSIGLKNKIKDYYTIIEGIKEVKEKIANPSLNDDVEELENDLVELEEGLEILDNKIVKGIVDYDKNKEKYAMLQEKMKKGREAKAKAKSEQGTQTQTLVQAETKLNVQQPQVQQGQQAQKPEDKTKKSSGWGWIAFAVIAGVVTLGAVNLMKRND
jgi:chromosome segregation ATPase